MQSLKKALALALALALVLSCIPALAGSAAADTGMTAVSTYALSEVTTSLTQDLTWIDIRNTNSPIEVHGLYDYTNRDQQNGNFVRMDPSVAASVTSDDSENFTTNGSNVWGHNQDTSGGRVRFSTNSRYVAVQALLPIIPTWGSYVGKENLAIDIYVDTVDGRELVKTILPASKVAAGTENYKLEGIVDLGTAEARNITIYMPLLNPVKEFYVGLSSDAQIGQNSKRYVAGSNIVYYGSSITEGGSANHPSGSYVALASNNLNSDFTNLGMWGSATGQPAFSDYIATLEGISVFVLDYDHNETQATFGEKHLAFYTKVRAEYPEIPIIMISRPNRALTYKENQHAAEKMKEVILTNYQNAAATDPNVHFIDGEAFFEYDGSKAGDETYNINYVYLMGDGVHPTPAGQAAMADVVANVISLANAGMKNIYVDVDEISFAGGSKEDILFDSTDAVKPMTQADWKGGSVSGKTLILGAGQSAALTADPHNQWSGYTAVADLTVAAGASASMTIGNTAITLSDLSATGCTVTVGSDAQVLTGLSLTENANSSIRLVLSVKLVNNGFTVTVNGKTNTFETGVMSGTLGFAAANGQVTVNSLQVTAPTQRSHYTALLGEKVGLNLHMHLAQDTANDTGAYMKFICGESETTVMLADAITDEFGNYVFSFDVAAMEMTDTVTAQFYTGSDTMIAQHSTTVKDYATYIVENDDYSDYHKNVASALLNYGAAAQEHFGHNESNLANGGSYGNGWGENVSADAFTKYTPTKPADTLEGVDFYGSSVVMEGQITIRHYFKTESLEGVTVSVSHEGAYKTGKQGSYCYVDITGIDAANLDLTYTLTLTSNTDAEQSITVNYSVMSYIGQLLVPPEGYTPSASMVKLGKALYLYSVAVESPETGDDEFEVLPL